MSEYTSAAVCRRGHVASVNIERRAPSKHCEKCGAKVLVACAQCEERIRGDYVSSGVVLPYTPPQFCDSCGAPHPWAGRQARLYQLQNILDEQNLDEATRLSVQEELEALQASEMSEEEQKKRWLRIKDLSPGLIQAGQRIIESIVTSGIKAGLGL